MFTAHPTGHDQSLGDYVLKVLDYGVGAVTHPQDFLQDEIKPVFFPFYEHGSNYASAAATQIHHHGTRALEIVQTNTQHHYHHSHALYTKHVHPIAGPLLERMLEKALRITLPVLRPMYNATHHHLHATIIPAYQHLESRVDNLTSGHSKLTVAIAAALGFFLLVILLSHISSRWARFRRVSILQHLSTAAKMIPGVKSMVRRDQEKIFASMREDVQKRDAGVATILKLPQYKTHADDLIAELEARAANDFRFADGASRATGTIYMTGTDHRDALNDAYCLFSQTNPLHPDQFPSVRRMEAEVVSMTAFIVGGGPDTNSEVVGAMTCGGTESITTAMFASLAYQRKHRGITAPEILIADSAHAAYFKAATYSGAKLVMVKVNQTTFELSAADVKQHMNKNTAVVVVSAVSYPHGVLDDVLGIATLCRKHNILVHVDACLGGFVLPFLSASGRSVKPWNFAVPGVTSMSVDTHKYGQGHKGTSVVLYSSRELRRCQYTCVTEWTGGLYVSPGIAGSRSGALIATAWTAMRHLGQEGYEAATNDMMNAADKLKRTVESIPELCLCGKPAMCNIAFMSCKRSFNVLTLNDLLAARKWNFAALIKPPALHFCFTHQHAHVADKMCEDLLECCAELRKMRGKHVNGGKAKIYGMASSLPDRQVLNDVLLEYQDIMLTP